MKHILIVYHKNSGRGNSSRLAQKMRTYLEQKKVVCMLYKSDSVEKMQEFFCELKNKNYEDLTIVMMGGDGTVGMGVDAIIKSGVNAKIAVFNAGTVNDFGTYLKMPKSPKKYAEMLVLGKTKMCDVAKANNTYFINVACGGYFTHGLNTYSRKDKKIFGKLAYWSKNIGVAFKMKPHKLFFSVDGKEFEENLYFYLIVNSCSAGGFKRIGLDSEIDDGVFEFIGIKPAKLGKLAALFFKLIRGRHRGNGQLVYHKGKHFCLKRDESDDHFKNVDTDGNRSEMFPLEIEVVSKKIELIIR